MKRLRRAYQRRIRKRKKFKRRVIVAGTAAAITLGTGISLNRALAVGMPNGHQLSVIQDTDADLLADLEELAIGYRPFKTDQNHNEVPDGIELARHCAAVIEQLPWEDEVASSEQTYKWLDAVFGLETCDICGETVNMGSAGIVNPHLGLRVDCPLIAIHYLEHGSFGYHGDVHEGRLDVAALLRALGVRFPYDPNEHQLAVVENDLDGDLLADSEELAAGYNLYNADQDNDLVADGIELARQCYEVIDTLPVPDPNGPEIMYTLYKEDFLQRGLEQCEICGQSVNMGYCRIVNSKLGLYIEVPYIVCHYMEHGSFSYSGDVHGEGRIDVALLTKILEMPRRCGDLGTIYLPADLNNDCQVNIDDMVEFIEQWLDFSDPNQV
ncbi:MAG: hypothetical protein PVH77_05185 [Phycisphaerales bacterium]|jgi:hypothetical protein